LGGLAYLNALGTPFVFDDVPRISENPLVRRWWPPWAPLARSTRPLTQWTLALNYAISGERTWSYHLLNVLVHLLAALALFELTRRTLLRVRLGADATRRAASLALAVALLWVAHPLQTQAVTYVIQRSESLMALFYLLALLAIERGATSARAAGWYAL